MALIEQIYSIFLDSLAGAGTYTPPAESKLLIEAGDVLLMETGDKLLLE